MCVCVLGVDNAGTNKAASSGTSLNTKRLDDDTENLARNSLYTLMIVIFDFTSFKQMLVSSSVFLVQ